MNLKPARWIWYPSERTLPNTFVLFRKEIALECAPKAAKGRIFADSRYILYVNGVRIQFGPAPCDPRWPEVDPTDITVNLVPGLNVIGVKVLYYGHAEGTWVQGNPGFLMQLDVEGTDGRSMTIGTDTSWMSAIDWSHRPGQFPRWFLRSLQEECDARKYRDGWETAGYLMDTSWKNAQVISERADKPPLCSSSVNYLHDLRCEDPEKTSVSARSIPLTREYCVEPERLAHTARIHWLQPPDDWFLFRSPGSFTAERTENAVLAGDNTWEVVLDGNANHAMALTFEFAEEGIGWPCFTVEAQEGTIIELVVQEGHDPDTTLWLDSQYYSWSRFICKEGLNRFETFDFESFRWMQLHIRGTAGPVKISNPRMRRRVYPFQTMPHIHCEDARLQRVFDAAVNTILNNSIETIVDGMARERQQYSGDVAHVHHALVLGFGEPGIVRRFLNTYSQGQTREGLFLSSYPGQDVLIRLGQRQTGTSKWGPIIDHSVQLVFDCWNYYSYTADREGIQAVYPRFARLARYIETLICANGLLPVEDIGVPVVWMDRYARQRHRQCPFNLYVSAMLLHALGPLADLFGDGADAAHYRDVGNAILDACVKVFWDADAQLFVDSLPWRAHGDEFRLSDRTLANALLFDQCPGNRVENCVKALVDMPQHLIRSYPPNAGWRYWALSKHERVDVILDEMRTIWAEMPSVLYNNTIGENWTQEPDSKSVWSHASVAPLYCLYMSILGLKPLAPGFREYEIKPQLSTIGNIHMKAFAGNGEVILQTERRSDGYRVTLETPVQGVGRLVVRNEAHLPLERLELSADGTATYRLIPGERSEFYLADNAQYRP